MESLYTFERILQSYQNTPRTYGTEELLYMTEVHVIKEIGNNSGLSLNELANKTYRTKSAMSTMLKGLVKKGLVKRKRDEKDNRRYILTLTDLGKRIYDYHEKLDFNNYSNYLERLEPVIDLKVEDLQMIAIVLENINKILNSRINS